MIGISSLPFCTLKLRMSRLISIPNFDHSDRLFASGQCLMAERVLQSASVASLLRSDGVATMFSRIEGVC